MKAPSIAVAVALVLASACFIQISAVPFSKVEMEEIDSPVMEHEDTAVHSMDLSLPLRVKRQTSHLSLCRWCYNCCHNKGFGFCCKF